ncbi:hypothetical protein K469DRAFT_641139 [Zopfia rhizophila CBS 207.26]|uniref:Uncharacterized protein n=1 Tax=Zopfia rhizophila CBS 207.26 TaxID=1314779 RepID=A0A6A6DIJ2_9PEZI|nr:hypothetical protein K469DRAFT_641139 [Zopfia rhizophila CBS 207.26]
MAEAEPSTSEAAVEPAPPVEAPNKPEPTGPAPPAAPITLRAPSSLKPTNETSTGEIAVPPNLAWLEATWHVTHSTLPMWKKNRNVQINYTIIPNTSPAHIDDLVTYQSISGTKVKTVHGVDKPFSPSNENTGREQASLGYNWRGKGLLAIASSKWEILGYGEEQGSGNRWVVTYFAKTLFTPAGVDIYSKDKQGLSKRTVEAIKAALAALGGDVANLAKDLFAITMDNARVS